MAEIKSTLDLVLEKTKHLTLSEEEKQIQRHDEFRKTLKGLIRKFADKALKMKELKKELEILQETYELKEKNILIREILKKIDLDRDNTVLLELLQELYSIKASNIRSLLKDYRDTRRSTAEKRIHGIKEDLSERHFISGSAIVPNLEADSEWQAAVRDIRHQFKPLLSREKAERIERLGYAEAS